MVVPARFLQSLSRYSISVFINQSPEVKYIRCSTTGAKNTPFLLLEVGYTCSIFHSVLDTKGTMILTNILSLTVKILRSLMSSINWKCLVLTDIAVLYIWLPIALT